MERYLDRSSPPPERRWKGFKYFFDEEKYIPSAAAIATYYLKLYDLELRCSNRDGWDVDPNGLDEILSGTALCESGELALAEYPEVMTTSLRVELQADEGFSARKLALRLRTGAEADLDPQINATISYFSKTWTDKDDAWILSIYLSNSQFDALKNYLLERSVRDITVGLKSQETLTNKYNERYADSRHLKWYLPNDDGGKPIAAACKIAVFAYSVGERWPPIPHDEAQGNEPDENHEAEDGGPKNDIRELVYATLAQHAQVIERMRMMIWLLVTITILVALSVVAITLG